MNFEDKLNNIYQEIANNANQIIPDEWKNIFMESEVTEGRSSVYFFYTLKRGRFYSHDIAIKFNVSKRIYKDILNELYECFKELRKIYKE